MQDLTKVDFKNCKGSKFKPTLTLNINTLIFNTISSYKYSLTTIALKYDLKNDLRVIRNAIPGIYPFPLNGFPLNAQSCPDLRSLSY